MNEVESTQSQLVKRMSDSDMVNNDLRLSFNKDALSQRPTTNNSSRRAVFSQDGRRQCIFRRSQKAARNIMDNSGDLIFWFDLNILIHAIKILEFPLDKV